MENVIRRDASPDYWAGYFSAKQEQGGIAERGYRCSVGLKSLQDVKEPCCFYYEAAWFNWIDGMLS